MPELPEVHTTVTGLQKVLPKLAITDVWTNLNSKDTRQKDSVKNPPYFKKFRLEVRGAKVLRVTRRAKNILIDLATENTILIHMKMTGHLLYGRYDYDKKSNTWYTHLAEKNEALRDPFNQHIRVLFSLSNGKHLAFSDVRKFGKITLVPTGIIHDSKHLAGIGPEPLDKNFTLEKFKERLAIGGKRKIKTVLMDQSVIAGVGNIYSDEMLWLAGVHPLSLPSQIPAQNIKKLYEAMKTVLNKGIDFGGDSTSDYRDINGEHGKFHYAHNAYQRTGEKCKKAGCGGIIQRQMIGGRSAHFCPKHQILYL